MTTPGAPPPSDEHVVVVPGQLRFGPRVDGFDRWADDQLERLRGRPVLDLVFSTATHLGDFSVIWHLVGVGRGVLRGRLDQTLVLAGLLSVESLIVNQGVKRLFRRERPTVDGDTRLRVRRPSTSAFPSGHASSAMFAASILTTWDGRRTAPVWFAIAAVVAVSRSYVRIHHASDVVGGAAIGLALGAVGSRVARRLAP